MRPAKPTSIRSSSSPMSGFAGCARRRRMGSFVLHDDLLALARRTLERDAGRGRPRQASLRRTISTAYYALFHLLVHEATSRMDLRGTPAAKAPYQRAL